MKMKYYTSILIFVALCTAEICFCDETFIPRKEFHQDSSKFFCMDEKGNRYFADTFIREMMLNVQYPDGKIISFMPRKLMNKVIEKTPEGDEWRREYPIICDITNVKSYKDGIVLIHMVRGQVRIIQIVDEKLNVSKYWDDDGLIYNREIPFPEPVVVTKNGSLFAIGEKGEILSYDISGKIIKRLVIKNIFNEQRLVKPRSVSEEHKRIYSETKSLEDIYIHDAQRATERLAARDKLLPKPVFIKGTEMPSSIKAMEARENGDIIIILDGEPTDKEKKDGVKREQKLYELNPETAGISVLEVPGFSLVKANMGKVKSEDKSEKNVGLPIWRDEHIVDIRCKKDNLYILTSFRMLHIFLDPEVKIIGEAQLHHSRTAYNGIPWDVKTGAPPKFLFVNYETQNVDEYPVTAEGVGKPLDCGVAEERKKKEEEEKAYIKMLDEVDSRHEAEEKIVPVLDEDSKAAEEIFRHFIELLAVKRDFAECARFLSEDFISADHYVGKAEYLKSLPENFPGEKWRDMNVKPKAICYVREDKGIIRAAFEISWKNKDGKSKTDSVKVRFIKNRDAWQIYELE